MDSYTGKRDFEGGFENGSKRHKSGARSLPTESDPMKTKGGETQQAPSNVLIVSVINARVPVTLDNLQQIFKPYGEVLRIITFVKDSAFKALVQLGSIEQALQAKTFLEGKDIFQGCCTLRIGFSKMTELKVTKNGPRARDFTQESSGGSYGSSPAYFPLVGSGSSAGGGLYETKYGSGMGGDYGGGATRGCVLLVSNLTPEQMTVDKLFILCGVFGDVLRVKILFNKRDTALVQFAKPEGAQMAQMHLNHLFLHTKKLVVSLSKHQEIALPRGGDPESEGASLTKDFSNSPIHRYRNSRNVKNINAPSTVLHVTNIYEGATEEELRKLFGQEATAAPQVQFFASNRKMAYVKLESVHEAVLCLIRFHNFKLGGAYLRVSFSSKDPHSIRDSDMAESAPQ